ncbi:hypothetical protein ACVWZV_000797 [Bradyrhizobium sp. GM5.1]
MPIRPSTRCAFGVVPNFESHASMPVRTRHEPAISTAGAIASAILLALMAEGHRVDRRQALAFRLVAAQTIGGIKQQAEQQRTLLVAQPPALAIRPPSSIFSRVSFLRA